MAHEKLSKSDQSLIDHARNAVDNLARGDYQDDGLERASGILSFSQSDLSPKAKTLAAQRMMMAFMRTLVQEAPAGSLLREYLGESNVKHDVELLRRLLQPVLFD